MAWIEGDGDANGDGFVDYARGAETGLANQGWKDSEDSVFHRDGRDPAGPIALVEVQGYVYAALRAMADLARAARRGEAGDRWAAKAERLRAAVEERFWIEERATTPWRWTARGSSAGCAPRTPAICCSRACRTPERAERVTAQLLGASFDTGWGIRTLAAGEARYNPMSYHNGSVWPHDTALCAAGMARYGERDGVAMLLSEHIRGRGPVRHAAAGAVLRLRAPARRAAHRLSRGLPAAGLGVRVGCS